MKNFGNISISSSLRQHLLPTAASVALAAAGALTCASAQAHEDDDIDEIIVEGRWTNPTGYLTSASEGIVGQVEIDLRPRLRTGELLEVVPGLIVTQHSGSGKSNQMFLRGFNLDHGTDFATWIDGMPINMPTHGHGQGYTDLNFLIPELIRTVEFRKGPYHAEVSDFSSAGAAFLSTFSKMPDGLLRAGIGENGFMRLVAADSIEAGGGNLLYAGQTHRYDGPWVGVNEDLDRYNGLIKYSKATDLGEWGVTFMGYDAQWNSADQIPARAVASGLVDELGTIDDTVGGQSSRYSLSGTWHRNLSAGKLRARGYVIDYELDLLSNFTYFLDDPVNGDQFQQIDDRVITGGDLTFTFGEDALRHTVGAMVRRDDINEVGLYRTVAGRRLSTVRQDQVVETSLGIYYDVEAQLTDRLRANVGLRADYFDFNVRTSNIAANAGTASDTLVSPKLGLIYWLNDMTELFLSAGRGFHSNDARGTTITVDPVSGDPIDRVDPLVSSDGAEIGVRFFRDQTLNLSASLWYLDLDSELLFVGDAGNTEASRPSRRYGLEIPLYYRPNERWTFDVELALTHSELRGDDPAGDKIPGALDRVVSAVRETAQYPNGMYGSLRARHFGPRPLIEDGSAEVEFINGLQPEPGLQA